VTTSAQHTAGPSKGPVLALEHASLGAPITRAGVTLFPVYLFQPLSAPVVTGLPDSIAVKEAESESVPTLSVTSKIDQVFLLVEGETVAGGLQTRSLNVSVLVPPRASLDIPVSCIEAGRWGGSRSFTGSAGHVSRRVRRAKSAGVEQSLRHTGRKTSNQGAVWDSVDYELTRLSMDAPTSNYADLEVIFAESSETAPQEHRRLADAATELIELGPLPGQCGVVVTHGSRVVAAEILATPELLAAQWAAMVRAHLLDAPAELHGRPSASRALRFILRLATSKATQAQGVGLGTERHIRTSRLVGQVLTWEDTMIHASAFALAA